MYYLHSRSSELARVETPVIDVLLDIIYSYFFRWFKIISTSLKKSLSNFILWSYIPPPAFCMYSKNSQYLESFLPSQSSLQSQELSPCFHRNGCFYAFQVSDILNRSLYSESLIPFVMPFESSINVDTILDFKIAQNLYPEFVDGTLLDI